MNPEGFTIQAKTVCQRNESAADLDSDHEVADFDLLLWLCVQVSEGRCNVVAV